MDRRLPQDARAAGDGGRRHQRRPSLVAADVGVALADIGSDVTIESADLVLMGDDLRKLAEAVECGRRVLRTIRQNIIGFAVIFNLASVAAASSGWISPVTAAVAPPGQFAGGGAEFAPPAGRFSRLAAPAGRLVVRPQTAAAGELPPRPPPWHWPSGLPAGCTHRRGQSAWSNISASGSCLVRSRAGTTGCPIRSPGIMSSAATNASRGNRFPQRTAVRSARAAEPPAYEWNVQHRGGGYRAGPEESYVWTGDENLIDVNLVVQYRLADRRPRCLGWAWTKWTRPPAGMFVRAGRGGLSRGNGPPRGRRPFGAAGGRSPRRSSAAPMLN